MIVVDATSGKIVAGNPIGGGVDAAEFDPKTGLVYFSTGADGVLSIFREKSPDEYELVENVPTQVGARTMAVDRKTGRVYVAVAELGEDVGSEELEALHDVLVAVLADLGAAQLVTPPKGLEIGYVPIATRQEQDTSGSVR